MRDPDKPLQIGFQVWAQNVSWPDLVAAASDIEAYGFDSLRSNDHFFPIAGTNWRSTEIWRDRYSRVDDPGRLRGPDAEDHGRLHGLGGGLPESCTTGQDEETLHAPAILRRELGRR